MIPSIYGTQSSGQVAPAAQDTQTVQQLADLNDRLKSDNYVLKVTAALGLGTAAILGLAVYAMSREDEATRHYKQSLARPHGHVPSYTPNYAPPQSYAPQGYAPRGYR